MSENNESKIESEEINQSEQPTPQEPPEETVGEIMQKAPSEGVKFWVIIVSVIVYLAGIVYAEVHGLTMLQNGVVPSMRIWAQLGMIAAGITAVALPVALKVWTIEAKQRIAAYMFYALDFGFLIFNAFTDFNTNTGQQLAPWAQTYVTYVLPASPIVVAALWALLWELDPSVKAKVLQLSLRAAMKEKLARKVADAAKGATVTAAVNDAAQREVDRALFELFGARPASGYYVIDEQKQGTGGWVSNFFGWLSRQGQSILSLGMPSQSRESPSEPSSQEPPKV